MPVSSKKYLLKKKAKSVTPLNPPHDRDFGGKVQLNIQVKRMLILSITLCPLLFLSLAWTFVNNPSSYMNPTPTVRRA